MHDDILLLLISHLFVSFLTLKLDVTFTYLFYQCKVLMSQMSHES